MKEELLPILILIAILVVVYLALRSFYRKRKKRLNDSRFHRRYK